MQRSLCLVVHIATAEALHGGTANIRALDNQVHSDRVEHDITGLIGYASCRSRHYPEAYSQPCPAFQLEEPWLIRRVVQAVAVAVAVAVVMFGERLTKDWQDTSKAFA
jgi:hypothetical protein